ncbi:hypothetical protein ES707_19960 [subsurface metagenome]
MIMIILFMMEVKIYLIRMFLIFLTGNIASLLQLQPGRMERNIILSRMLLMKLLTKKLWFPQIHLSLMLPLPPVELLNH